MSVVISGDTGIDTNSVQWLTGMIIPFGNETAPSGWLACDGSAVSRTTYARLFAAIGTKWGVGDGSTTFNLPDMRETVPVGTGTRGSGVTAHDTYDVGEFKDDQGQGHKHPYSANNTASDWYNMGVAGSSTTSSRIYTVAGTNTSSIIETSPGVHTPSSDGTNGTPRTGTTTHGKQAGVLYCIKE